MLMNQAAVHAPHLDAVFHALSDPTRRAMLGRLAERECTIGELANPFSMSFAGASKHVRVLEDAGLVRRAVRGRSHVCRLEAARLGEANTWLRRYERFWTESLERLDSFLREEQGAMAKESSDGKREQTATSGAAKSTVRPTSAVKTPGRLRRPSRSGRV